MNAEGKFAKLIHNNTMKSLNILLIALAGMTIFVLVCLLFLAPINYWVLDMPFQQLWRYTFFDGLAVFCCAYPLAIQYRSILTMKRRWRQSYALRTFVPSRKTVLIVAAGFSLCALTIFVRSMLFADGSWQTVLRTSEVIRLTLYLEVILLFALFFYTLYLVLFVKRKAV